MIKFTLTAAAFAAPWFLLLNYVHGLTQRIVVGCLLLAVEVAVVILNRKKL